MANKKYFIPGIEKAPYVPLEEADKMWAEAATFEKSQIEKAFGVPKELLDDKFADTFRDALKSAAKVVADKHIEDLKKVLWDPVLGEKTWPETGPGEPPEKTELQEQMEDWFP